MVGRSPGAAGLAGHLSRGAALGWQRHQRDGTGRGDTGQGLSGPAALHAGEQSRNRAGPTPESWGAGKVRATGTLPGAENGHHEPLVSGPDAGEGDGVCQPWFAKKADPRGLPADMVPKVWSGSWEPTFLTCNQAIPRQVV